MYIKNAILRLLRLNSLTGLYLLILPVLWAFALIPYNLINIKILIVFILGALVMRSVGCVINDIIDYKIDCKVGRTKTRPIASGEISIKQAFLILIIGLIIGLVLLLQLNQKTILIGSFSVILIITYPFMKKITYWPQAFLGITFNLGVIMVSSSCLNKISLSFIFLYIGSVFWTLAYDTIYAHQDKEDDLRIGIKSTALLFKEKTKIFLYISYAVLFVSLLLIGGLNQFSYMFYLGLVISFAFLAKNIFKLNINDSYNCFNQFKMNTKFGLLILISLIMSKI